jgi:hypothetical protein
MLRPIPLALIAIAMLAEAAHAAPCPGARAVALCQRVEELCGVEKAPLVPPPAVLPVAEAPPVLAVAPPVSRPLSALRARAGKLAAMVSSIANLPRLVAGKWGCLMRSTEAPPPAAFVRRQRKLTLY